MTYSVAWPNACPAVVVRPSVGKPLGECFHGPVMNFFSLFYRSPGKVPSTPSHAANRYAPYHAKSPSKPSRSRAAPLVRCNAMFIDPTPSPSSPESSEGQKHASNNEALPNVDVAHQTRTPCSRPVPRRADDGYDSAGDYTCSSGSESEDESGPYTPQDTCSLPFELGQEKMNDSHAAPSANEPNAADLKRKLEESVRQLEEQRTQLHQALKAASDAEARREEEEARLRRTMETYNYKIQTLQTMRHEEQVEAERQQKELATTIEQLTSKLDDEKWRSQKAITELLEWKKRADDAAQECERIRAECMAALQDRERVCASMQEEILRLQGELQRLRPPPHPEPMDEHALLRFKFQVYEEKWHALKTNPMLFNLQFSHMPWPVQDERLLDDPDNLTHDAIQSFIMHEYRPEPIATLKPRDRIKAEILRFHPDKYTAVLRKVHPDDQQRCQALAERITQILNDLLSASER